MLRRTTIAALLAASAALPAQAAPARPLITDPRGDWQISAQDIAAGNLATVAAASGEALAATVDLVEAPAQGVVTYYSFGFSVGCRFYEARFVWTGLTSDTAELLEYDCVREEPVDTADRITPITARVSGATVTLTIPLGGELVRGRRLDYPLAAAWDGAFVMYGGMGNDMQFAPGDIAFGNRSFVIGADRPRRR